MCPATHRLLERIFELPIAELLSPPGTDRQEDASADELRNRLGSAARVDDEVIRLLHEQLWTIRRFDRQLGVVVARQETVVKAQFRTTTRTTSGPLLLTVVRRFESPAGD